MKNNCSKKTWAISAVLLSSIYLHAVEGVDPVEGPNDLPPQEDNVLKADNNLIKDDEPMLTEETAVTKDVFINSLTLVDESLPQVLNLLERWTDRILVQANNLPKAVFNLNIPMPLTKEEAISILKSALSANGIAVVPLNDKALRIVPLTRAKSSAPKFIEREQLEKIPGSQEIGCCLFRVNNLVAREAARNFTPLLTPLNSSVVTLDKANSILVTDTLCNLQHLDRILKNVDKVGDVKDAILFFYPKNAKAEDLKKNFENLQQGALKCYLLGNTSFAADKNTNLFIAVTPKGNEKLIQEFFDKLDNNVDPLIQHHVFRVQHGSSKEITEMIKKLMQQKRQSDTNNGEAFSEQLKVECDDRLNAIVAYGTPSDMRQIQTLVNQLDVVLPQVRIEVIIAEVKLTKGQASGLESFGYNVDARKATHTLSSVNFASLVGGKESAVIKTLKAPGFSMDAVFNVAKTNANVSILSSPTLLTTHAREASLKISETRPYATGSIRDDTNNTTKNTYEKVDAGIELTVKPLIGLNGIIQMEIDQHVDNFVLTDTNSNAQSPTIQRRQAKSFISVQSGEMLVLGGIKQKEITDTKRRMFILGDLPILGDTLFSSKAKQEEVKELIIFIRPFLLADNTSSKQDAELYKSHLENETREEVEAYQKNGHFSKKSIFTENKRRKLYKGRPTLHGKRLRLRSNVNK